MLCKRHKIFYGLLPLFLLFFSFFFSSFSVNDTYAVEDLTYTIDSSTSNYTYICSTDCSSYKYILFEVSGPFSLSGSINIRYGIPGDSTTFSVSLFNTFSFVYFSDFSLNYLRFETAATLNNRSVKVTLSENNPFSSGIIPSGSIELTENGTYDVTNYAEAVVNVPESSGGGSGGNYHEDLVNIYHAIMICGAIVLVLYFFYCIYRVIIKSTGGK